MSFEIQETLIVHTSLSYLSLALPLSSLCAAHLCCTIHQYAAGLHCLPQRKPGAPSIRRGAGFRSCQDLWLNIHLSSCSAWGLANWQEQGNSYPEPIWSAYNVEPLVDVSGHIWMGFMKLMHLLQVYINAFRVQGMSRCSKIRHHIIHCLDVECSDAHPFSFEEHAQYVHHLHEM